MSRYVEISFDCLPLRSVGRLDIPIDASPKYRQRCERIKTALEKHGSHNTYFLYNSLCTFHLTNRADVGIIQFHFEGTAVTDTEDRHCERCDLEAVLAQDTCHGLTEPVVEWFRQMVSRAVAIEFDRYIEAGDLEQTRKRIEQIRAASDDAEGYVGMYL
jgi:hypothetical protein